MDGHAIDQIRSFNRTVQERIGALTDRFLERPYPLGEASVARWPAHGLPGLAFGDHALSAAAHDLHIFSSGGHALGNPDEWYWELYVSLLLPQSRGAIVVAPGSKGSEFKISHNHFSDEENADIQAVLDGVRHARGIAATSPLRESLVAEKEPGSRVASDEEIRNWIQHSHMHYWHPAGTCRMGPHRADGDVCNGRGRVHGVENLFVADASVMPVITGCNTNIPTALIGWRMARSVGDFLDDRVLR